MPRHSCRHCGKKRPFVSLAFTAAGARGRKPRRRLRAAAAPVQSRIRRLSSSSSSHRGTELLRIPGPLDPNPRPVMTSTQRRPASWDAVTNLARLRRFTLCSEIFAEQVIDRQGLQWAKTGQIGRSADQVYSHRRQYADNLRPSCSWAAKSGGRMASNIATERCREHAVAGGRVV
jgi:hypothetical protein